MQYPHHYASWFKVWVKLLGPQEMELPTNMPIVKYDPPKTNEYLPKNAVWKTSFRLKIVPFQVTFAKIFRGGGGGVVILWSQFLDMIPFQSSPRCQWRWVEKAKTWDAQGCALKKLPPKPWELTHLLDPWNGIICGGLFPKKKIRDKSATLRICSQFFACKMEIKELEKLCDVNMWIICKVFNHVEFLVNDKATPDFWICSNLSFGLLHPTKSYLKKSPEVVYFFTLYVHFQGVWPWVLGPKKIKSFLLCPNGLSHLNTPKIPFMAVMWVH